MSWRTQGQYRGLGESDLEWLQAFNGAWDTKAMGRNQGDAHEHLKGSRPDVASLPGQSVQESDLELQISTLRHVIARFTVPKETRHGWSIHLILKCGKRVRAHFRYKGEAFQAYVVIKDTLAMMFAS